MDRKNLAPVDPESTTDPDARLYRKRPGQASRLCLMGHVLIENRNGLIVESAIIHGGGRKQWEAGLDMLLTYSHRRGCTVGADRGSDVRAFVESCRHQSVSPHVAARRRFSAIDGRTTSGTGYRLSQQKRKRVDEPFGWMKTYGNLRKLVHRGLDKVEFQFRLAACAWNLMRIKALL